MSDCGLFIFEGPFVGIKAFQLKCSKPVRIRFWSIFPHPVYQTKSY